MIKHLSYGYFNNTHNDYLLYMEFLLCLRKKKLSRLGIYYFTGCAPKNQLMHGCSVCRVKKTLSQFVGVLTS